jgi:hypothetical protein
VFGLFSKSYDELMQKAETALAAGDAKAALSSAQKALSAAKGDVAKSGEAMIVAAMAMEIAQPASVQQFAALALTLLPDNSARRARGIALLRRHLDLAADAADVDVVSFAWEIDSAVKLAQGDLQGAVTAMQQSCGLLAVAYGADNPKQASVLSRCGGRMAQAGMADQAPHILVEIAEAGLKRVEKGGVSSIVHVNLLRLGMQGAVGVSDFERARGFLLQEIALIAGLPEQKADLEQAKRNLAEVEKGLAMRASEALANAPEVWGIKLSTEGELVDVLTSQAQAEAALADAKSPRS